MSACFSKSGLCATDSAETIGVLNVWSSSMDDLVDPAGRGASFPPRVCSVLRKSKPYEFPAMMSMNGAVQCVCICVCDRDRDRVGEKSGNDRLRDAVIVVADVVVGCRLSVVG